MNTATLQYDRGIVPAESAARQKREGKLFGITAKTDKQVPGSINTTGGYTVDQEGLVNNYAVEPEMYINQPGDLRQQERDLAAKRTYELEALAEEGAGRLTLKEDIRYKGPGWI